MLPSANISDRTGGRGIAYFYVCAHLLKVTYDAANDQRDLSGLVDRTICCHGNSSLRQHSAPSLGI